MARNTVNNEYYLVCRNNNSRETIVARLDDVNIETEYLTTNLNYIPDESLPKVLSRADLRVYARIISERIVEHRLCNPITDEDIEQIFND